MVKDRTNKEHEEESRNKLVPQVRCRIPESAVCDLETEWRESTDGWRRVTSSDGSSGSRRLEIAQVTWRRILDRGAYIWWK